MQNPMTVDEAMRRVEQQPEASMAAIGRLAARQHVARVTHVQTMELVRRGTVGPGSTEDTLRQLSDAEAELAAAIDHLLTSPVQTSAETEGEGNGENRGGGSTS